MSKIEWEQINDCSTELDRRIPCYKAIDMELVAYIVDKNDITGIKKELMVGKYAHMYNNFGTYLLVGNNADGTKNLYVGKAGERESAEEGFDRVKEHIKNKDKYYDKWDYCVYITNVENNMDSGVVLELERNLITLVKHSTTGKVISLNSKKGEMGGVPRSRWSNAYNAIIDFLSEPLIGCNLVDTVSIKADTEVVQKEIVDVNIINSYSTKSTYNTDDEDTKEIAEYKKIEMYDNLRKELSKTEVYEYRGRVYNTNKIVSENTIYGKKSEVVVTPSFIASDMVKLIPKSEFKSTSKFLCLASKDGVFANELIDILMSDDEELPINSEVEFKDKRIRLKHIVENMIYVVCELSDLADFTILNIIDHVRDIDRNINIGGYLLETNVSIPNVKCIFNLRNIIKERGILYTKQAILKSFELCSDTDNMKFDVVIGNPPYNRGADIDFVVMAKGLAKDCVSMIIPAKWQTAEANQKIASSKDYGHFRQHIVPYMKHIVFYPCCKDVFSDIYQTDGITYFVADNEVHRECVVENKCNDIECFNSIETRAINNGESLINICNEIIQYLGEYEKFTFPKVEGTKRYQLWMNTKVSGYDWYATKKPRYVLSTSEILDTHKGEQYFGEGKCIFETNDINECISFWSYMYLKSTRFFLMANISKLNNIQTDHCFRFVPAPPNGKFDHRFTDEEIYKHFNMPQKYIDVIDALIKTRE